MRKAFTLIELLVVISIIALLIAILLPVLGQAKESARNVQCLSNIKQFALTTVNYATDNDGATIPSIDPNPDAPNGGNWWTTSMFEYSQDETLAFCPQATTISPDPQMGQLSFGDRQTAWWDGLQFPEASNKPEVASYGQNMWVNNYENSITNFGVPREPYWERGIEIPGDSSNIPLYLDCMWVGGFPLDTDLPLSAENTQASYSLSPQMNRFALTRHFQRGVNASFLDGHAEGVDVPDLWTLEWNQTFTQRDNIVVTWY